LQNAQTRFAQRPPASSFLPSQNNERPELPPPPGQSPTNSAEEAFNQAAFVEETLRSVLEQDYRHKEYLVIDGNSTDGSAEIIRRYADRLTYWVSEPDRGQSHAINKGFALARGEVLGWVNSDDTLLSGALATVAKCFVEHPEIDLVYGDYGYTDSEGRVLLRRRLFDSMSYETLLYHDYLGQPAVFFRRSLLDRVGPVDEQLYYHMDWELFLRMWKVCRPLHVPVCLATSRLVPAAKSNAQDSAKYLAGTLLVQRRHTNQRFASPWLNRLWHRGCFYGSFGLRAWAVMRENPFRYVKILRGLFPGRRFLRLWRMRLKCPF
jgi:glycosyltransferase involved in cell wall biosynthesis